MTRAIINRYHAEMYRAPNNVEKISRVNLYPGSKVATPLKVPRIQFREHVASNGAKASHWTIICNISVIVTGTIV